MRGNELSKLEDTQTFLAALEDCQDRLEHALHQSDLSAAIHIDGERHLFLENALEQNLQYGSAKDQERLAILKARADHSLDTLRDLMKTLGANAGRYKRALIGYRSGA
jgi:ElaB/YqjD/DUF883 family membrane-anchored ribosome-binding protein